MGRKRGRWIGIVLMVGVLAGWAALAAADSHVASLVRTTVVTPTPTSPGATVVWSVRGLEFESRYPHGFVFSAALNSSAADIVRARVVWSHAPGTQRSRPAVYDPGSGRWVAAWEPAGRDAVPPWLGITYYWDISDAAGNSFQSLPENVEYADAAHDWVRAASDDVIVFTLGLGDTVGQQAVEAMAAQRETYRAAWGDLLPYVPRVILFGERAAWREWQLGTLDNAMIGTTQSDWGATVQVMSGGSVRDLVYGTVLHEVAHLYQAEFVGALPVNWFVEGNASFFEISRPYDYEGSARRLAADDALPVLLAGTGPGLSTRRGYDIGYTFFVWLVEAYGLDGHRHLMRLIGGGLTRNAALEAVTGLSTSEIESRWRVWLGASAAVPTLRPTPTGLFFPSPTPFVPGS